jgi:hypothetical protein
LLFGVSAKSKKEKPKTLRSLRLCGEYFLLFAAYDRKKQAASTSVRLARKCRFSKIFKTKVLF